VKTEIEQRIEKSYAKQNAMKNIGAVITEIGSGPVAIELPVRTDLTQETGCIDAGIGTMIVDTACGSAAYSVMPSTAAVVTVD
jgi:acyl-coenzyme A thioesterase PaaI-like protein